MFSTMDSQPQEWLVHDSNLLHTLCICSFRDGASAQEWIHRLVPRDKNGRFLKWSGKGREARNLKRRKQFIEQVAEHYNAIDFSVYCISSTEAQISQFAQAFFWMNQENVTQEVDAKGRNCLVLSINKEKKIRLPVLRAAKLIWIYFCIQYLKEVNGLAGYIYSDWFSNDTMVGEDKALGVAVVNFLLSNTGMGLQLSIAKNPGQNQLDLLSDWFAGWSNSSKGGTTSIEFERSFEELLERSPKKVDWVMYACNVEIVHG